MAARELPSRPNLEQYRKQAKDLLRRSRSGDLEALRRIVRVHPRLSQLSDDDLHKRRFALSDAHLALAREHGFDSWPTFVKHIGALTGERLSATVWRRAETAIVAGDVITLERLLREHEDILRNQRPQSSWLGGLTPDYEAGGARAIIVSTHYFENWEQFQVHLETLTDRDSPVARFEAAVDAVVSGDIATLERLLHRDPELIRARSTRKHHSTLLIYVGANGVEGFRQRTPKNAVQVAKTLLTAGAEVEAVGDMYGGSTTLGLVATSIHPKLAGVQEALLEMLLANGARLDHPQAGAGHPRSLVKSCLANGRVEAAAFLASRGAVLDLEGAAGLGRLDIVTSFFNGDGTLRPGGTMEQARYGLLWACEYGRTNVVQFLLDSGMDVSARLPRHGLFHGTTALHLAAFGGHADTVKTLLKSGAPVDVKDEHFGTPPLVWALYAWANEPGIGPTTNYHEVVARLVRAGSKPGPYWLAHEKVRADATMLAALTGELPGRG
jgi:Ankyrin repeats (3 copies)